MTDKILGKSQPASAYGLTAAEAAAYVMRELEGLYEIADRHRELALLAYLIRLAGAESAVRAEEGLDYAGLQ